MQVVILAAGRGTRMGKLTETLPKPMLQVAGKTLLEHKFDVLPDEIDEIILVIGYLGGKIREKFGNSYKGKKITYVEQANIVGGTADALWQAKNLLKGKFLVIYGDDIYAGEDLSALSAKDWAMLVRQVSDTSGGGKVVVGVNHVITDVVENSHHSGGAGYIFAGALTLDGRIFEYPQVPKAPDSMEIGLPQTIVAASKAGSIPFIAVEAHQWIQITAPEDLEKAEHTISAGIQ